MTWDLQRKPGRESASHDADTDSELDLDSKQDRARAQRVSRSLLKAELAKPRHGKDGQEPAASGDHATALDAHLAPSGTARPAVQLKAGKAHKPEKPVEWPVAEATISAAADIAQHQRAKLIAAAPQQFQPMLWLLYHAVTGGRGDARLSGADRVQQLDAAMVGLEPAIAVYRASEEGATWLNEQLMSHVTSIRSSARFQRAMDRVDASIRIGDETVEIPADDRPHEQGSLLHEELKKLVPTLQILNEQVIRAAHDTIHHDAQALIAGGHPHGKKLGPGTLVELQGLLMLIDGFLLMTDEEFKHHLNHVHGFFNGVATYSEFVKAAVEVAGGALMTGAAYAGAMAQQMGNAGAAAACSGLVKGAGLVFGNIVAGIEVIHGLALLFDGSATRQERIDGGVSASSGIAWFVGNHIWSAGVGAAASSIVLATYAEIKFAAELYWQSNLGLTSGLMRPAFDTIQREGNAIAMSADKLAKVGMLMAKEQDPAMSADLQRVHEVVLHQLAYDLDYFISDCMAPRDIESGVAQYPGAFTVMRELFAPLAKYRGAKSEDKVVFGARLALEKIAWCINHAGDLIVGSAKSKHLPEVQRDVAQREDNQKEH